jgi:6-phosphogluconolactonase
VAKLGSWRITLTLPVLNRADAAVFLVTGGDKAETLAAVLEGPPKPDGYPSQLIRPVAGTLIWLVDRAAAARLAAPAAR